MPDLRPGYNLIRTGTEMFSVPRTLRSAKRCAADPGSMVDPYTWVPALRSTVKTVHRVRDTRHKFGLERKIPMFEKNLLAAKRILVTGGGSGLGAAMGRRFVELGAELIICGRRLEVLEATAAQMRSDPGGKVSAITCDIRDGADVDA